MASPPRIEPAPTPAERATSLITTLRRRWPIGLLVVIVAVAVGAGMSARAPRSYSASSQLLVGSTNTVASLIGGTSAPAASDLERDADTNLALIRLEATAEKVRKALGL